MQSLINILVVFEEHVTPSLDLYRKRHYDINDTTYSLFYTNITTIYNTQKTHNTAYNMLFKHRKF